MKKHKIRNHSESTIPLPAGEYCYKIVSVEGETLWNANMQVTLTVEIEPGDTTFAHSFLFNPFSPNEEAYFGYLQFLESLGVSLWQFFKSETPEADLEGLRGRFRLSVHKSHGKLCNKVDAWLPRPSSN